MAEVYGAEEAACEKAGGFSGGGAKNLLLGTLAERFSVTLTLGWGVGESGAGFS